MPLFVCPYTVNVPWPPFLSVCVVQIFSTFNIFFQRDVQFPVLLFVPAPLSRKPLLSQTFIPIVFLFFLHPQAELKMQTKRPVPPDAPAFALPFHVVIHVYSFRPPRYISLFPPHNLLCYRAETSSVPPTPPLFSSEIILYFSKSNLENFFP